MTFFFFIISPFSARIVAWYPHDPFRFSMLPTEAFGDVSWASPRPPFAATALSLPHCGCPLPRWAWLLGGQRRFPLGPYPPTEMVSSQESMSGINNSCQREGGSERAEGLPAGGQILTLRPAGKEAECRPSHSFAATGPSAYSSDWERRPHYTWHIHCQPLTHPSPLLECYTCSANSF